MVPKISQHTKSLRNENRYHNEIFIHSINRRIEHKTENETSKSNESDISAALNETSIIMKTYLQKYKMFDEGQSQLKNKSIKNQTTC
ncbi:hypothetical protein RCL_jg19972.t1 [Rhizophagus clarus]|uniref:Uncharacterized protein n=1 Tax=Rhizophagus clarus TaxID=94130 RepID=A0A8H3L749_9GLOM|nr:hypothetical protein RCL_jg19972.t1 [Rhizophagus clarus]